MIYRSPIQIVVFFFASSLVIIHPCSICYISRIPISEHTDHAPVETGLVKKMTHLQFYHSSEA